MLTLQQIIDEADVLVPNSYTPADKVSWLNAINQEFFDVVQIPDVALFTTVANQASYVLQNTIRAKSIDKVHVGMLIYRSLLYEDVQPAQNNWTFNDTTFTLTLTPAPYQTGLQGKVRYHRVATTTFLSGNLNVSPDAPPEYHWIYTLGLCSKIAKAMDDIAKANNYASEYNNALSVAAQNYQKMGS